MLQEAKQKFENEMIRMIENNQESDQKSSINFTKMIDNEELQSALKSCVHELEMYVKVAFGKHFRVKRFYFDLISAVKQNQMPEYLN